MPNGAQILLTWNGGSGSNVGVSYIVERAKNGGAFTYLATVVGQSYADSALVPNAVYTYRVKAVNSEGTSDYTSTASATAPASIPLSVWADDADRDGVRDNEETLLGSNPSVPASPDTSGVLKLRIYLPKP